MGHTLTAGQKALQINLDSTIYGTFAEIGAGQEVANHFFKAGAASGTVAKSISAYDMVFSDSIYGKEEGKRYVCRSRLMKMIDYEFDLVVERLKATRKDGRFFAFANTVSARNYFGTNEQHGWSGVRFYNKTNSEPSELIVHTRLHDNTNLRQQDALGVLGVNMMYTSYYKSDESSEQFVNSLMEGLNSNQIEIDMISFKGPAFDGLDERLVNLQLVKSEITDCVVFKADGSICLAGDELYKKNILVARGSYRPPTIVNMDLIERGEKKFTDEIKDADVISLAEITISKLQNEGGIANDDFLARVDMLASMNQMVMVSSFKQYYKLTSFFQRFRPKNVGIVLGVYNFMQIFNSEYTESAGATLEAIGLLLGENVRIYLYPYQEIKGGEIFHLSNIEVTKKNAPLLDFIKQTGRIVDLKGTDPDMLHIYSRKVLEKIKSKKPGWEKYVPESVAKAVKEKCLFGYPCDL